MRKYDEEYKQAAVKKIHDGQSVASVSRELGVAESLLHNWKRQVVDSSSDSDKELLALKKRIQELEMERDILKRKGQAVRGLCPEKLDRLIPKTLRETAERVHGEQSRLWLENVRALIQAYHARWSLELDRSFENLSLQSRHQGAKQVSSTGSHQIRGGGYVSNYDHQTQYSNTRVPNCSLRLRL